MGDRGTSQGERFGDKVKECKEDSGCTEEGILNMELSGQKHLKIYIY